jgi:D-3-phosphoglycerate dehydrogenase
MAFLLAQLSKSEIRSIKISAEGEVSEYLDSLQTFATVGVLSVSSGDEVNYVNANFIAKEKGIELTTSGLSNHSGYQNKVSIKITTPTGVKTISGTVFNDDVQRIVELNGFSLDIEPKGKMIVMRNNDVPGVIGEVGRILGDNNINIADFRLSRGKDGALAVILIDEKVSSDILKKLNNLEAAIAVAYAEI